MSKERLPLSTEENNRRLLFIGTAVDTGAVLPFNGRMGATQTMTVQDLANAQEETLKRVGKQLEKLVRENTASRFDEDEKDFTIGGLPPEGWIDFIALTLQKIRFERRLAEEAAELRRIDRELEELKTPGERRNELLARQAQLKGISPVTATESAQVPESQL